jgi:hypothetical protein
LLRRRDTLRFALGLREIRAKIRAGFVRASLALHELREAEGIALSATPGPHSFAALCQAL